MPPYTLRIPLSFSLFFFLSFLSSIFILLSNDRFFLTQQSNPHPGYATMPYFIFSNFLIFHNNHLHFSIVEAVLRPGCFKSIDQIEENIKKTLESNCTTYKNGHFNFSSFPLLQNDLMEITICDIPIELEPISFWKVQLQIHIYSLNDSGPCDEILDNSMDVTAYQQWVLPCIEFHHLWDRYSFSLFLHSIT